ncbi:pickpocket protein 19 [Drosophila grimshawi]|uniref:pickpocket protein 19 n=1 Tax=Drosophila grimshawi TaxID=7222 RepID=UPI0013EEF984|nr:pickpocket protein 19 [Drosophila grimshawi]
MKHNSCIDFLKINFYNKRLFWLIVISASGWNMAAIFILIMARFHTDLTSIGVTTSYIHWTNTFPSVSICLVKNRITEDFAEFIQERIPGNETQTAIYRRNIFDYLFLSPENMNIKEAYCRGYNSTCGVDIRILRRELLPRSCKNIIKVYYSDALVPDCETIFKFHELEMGYCFLANNLMDYDNMDLLPLKFSSTKHHPILKLVMQGQLIFKYQVYVHSPEDVPYFNAVRFLTTNKITAHTFNIEEMQYNADVIEVNVDQRMCKFPSESSNSHFVYSFSSCMSQIRTNMEMKACNCTLFNPLTDKNDCSMKGIKCLEEADISERVKQYVGANLVCLPSCVEQQISHVGSVEYNGVHDDYIVEIEIASTPSVRFHRSVTQTTLDLIVAIGGVIGLFIGASLLNILELVSMILRKLKYLFSN